MSDPDLDLVATAAVHGMPAGATSEQRATARDVADLFARAATPLPVAVCGWRPEDLARLAQARNEVAIRGAAVANALAAFAVGDFERAWRSWEQRGAGPLPEELRWEGQPLAGRRLRVVAEPFDGLGDHIMWSRWLQQLPAGALYEPPEPLARLFASSFPKLRIEAPHFVNAEEALRLLDVPGDDRELQVRAFSLAAIFGARLGTIPGRPYLMAPAAHIERWRPQLPTGRPRVGIVWTAGPRWEGPVRSIPLRELAPLWRATADFVSLQVGNGVEQIEGAREHQPMAVLQGVRDFADTAAVMAQLDLVVSVDTSAVHLAGALGVPTLLLARRDADWRWHDETVARLWYPTVRIFRQSTPGDWRDPVEEAAAALTKLLDSK